jgi:hypothetical protein
MTYEVIKNKDGTWKCRDKEGKRRKTYLQGDRTEAIKCMRRLYLADARKRRGLKKKIEVTNIEDANEEKEE